MNEFDFLEEQGVAEGLIQAAADYRKEYGVSEEAKHRLMKPSLPFYGKETLEMGMAAILEGENLLLAGPKATGKMCWQRIWHIFSDVRCITYLSMSIPTAET